MARIWGFASIICCSIGFDAMICRKIKIENCREREFFFFQHHSTSRGYTCCITLGSDIICWNMGFCIICCI